MQGVDFLLLMVEDREHLAKYEGNEVDGQRGDGERSVGGLVEESGAWSWFVSEALCSYIPALIFLYSLSELSYQVAWPQVKGQSSIPCGRNSSSPRPRIWVEWPTIERPSYLSKANAVISQKSDRVSS